MTVIRNLLTTRVNLHHHGLMLQRAYDNIKSIHQAGNVTHIEWEGQPMGWEWRCGTGLAA